MTATLILTQKLMFKLSWRIRYLDEGYGRNKTFTKLIDLTHQQIDNLIQFLGLRARQVEYYIVGCLWIYIKDKNNLLIGLFRPTKFKHILCTSSKTFTWLLLYHSAFHHNMIPMSRRLSNFRQILLILYYLFYYIF